MSNIVNEIMGTIGNATIDSLQFSVPKYVEDRIENLLRSLWQNNQTTILFALPWLATQKFRVSDDIITFLKLTKCKI